MRYLSVCSGIEAATVAWHPLGWEAAAFAEIEPFPRAVLAHRWPDVPQVGDFTEIDGGEFGPVDVLVGGTPCQSFSVAGLRKGLADDRGNLALQFFALAARTRPAWVVWENVPGVLSNDEGRAFGSILGALGELGYGWAYRILDAQYWGVAQRRRRVFVVGSLGGWAAAGAVLFERESLCGNPAPRREKGARIAGTLEARAGTGGYDPGAHGAASGHLIPEISGPLTARARHDVDEEFNGSGYLLPMAYGGNNTRGALEVSTAVRAKGGTGHGDFESETFVAHTLRGEGHDASEDGTGRGVPLVPIAHTLHCQDGHGGGDEYGYGGDNLIFQPRFARNGRGAPETMASALTGEAGRTGKGDSAQCVAGSVGVRRLTPRECERLQGFPDDYTRVPIRVYKHRPKTKHFGKFRELYEKNRDGTWTRYVADGPRYKAIGNSMATPVMHWLGKRIAAVQAILRGVAA